MSSNTSANLFSCSEYSIVCNSIQALSYYMSIANYSLYCYSIYNKRYPTEKGLDNYFKTYTRYPCPESGCKEVFELSVLL